MNYNQKLSYERKLKMNELELYSIDINGLENYFHLDLAETEEELTEEMKKQHENIEFKTALLWATTKPELEEDTGLKTINTKLSMSCPFFFIVELIANGVDVIMNSQPIDELDNPKYSFIDHVTPFVDDTVLDRVEVLRKDYNKLNSKSNKTEKEKNELLDKKYNLFSSLPLGTMVNITIITDYYKLKRLVLKHQYAEYDLREQFVNLLLDNIPLLKEIVKPIINEDRI